MRNETSIMQAISRSSASFRSLNSKLHMVLFFDRNVFDYIPDTNEIRPYNSGQWLKFKRDGPFKELLNYLKEIYDSVLDAYNHGTINDSYIVYGFIMDSIVAIDINMLLQYLLQMQSIMNILQQSSDPGEKSLITFDNRLLVVECEEFITYLKNEYEYWEEEIVRSLNYRNRREKENEIN